MRASDALLLLLASFVKLAASTSTETSIETSHRCSVCISAGGIWYTGDIRALNSNFFHDSQDAGGQCFSPLQSDGFKSMYKYKVTQCRNERNSGVASQNEYYDSASASKCTPNIGQASCAGCTSVSGCLFSSQINYDPGRATLGLCSSQADQTYSYRTPASCDASGEANGAAANIWVSIIPLLLIIAYILNAVVVSIVAKKRGNNPCAWFFVALLFNMWTWICLLACTSKQPARSTVVPITTAATSTAFVPPLPPYGQGGSAYPYNSHPAAYPPGSYPPPPGYSHGAYSSSPLQQQPPLVPHSTAYVASPALLHSPPNPYVASPALLQPPPNPYGAPVYSSKPA